MRPERAKASGDKRYEFMLLPFQGVPHCCAIPRVLPWAMSFCPCRARPSSFCVFIYSISNFGMPPTIGSLLYVRPLKKNAGRSLAGRVDFNYALCLRTDNFYNSPCRLLQRFPLGVKAKMMKIMQGTATTANTM